MTKQQQAKIAAAGLIALALAPVLVLALGPWLAIAPVFMLGALAGAGAVLSGSASWVAIAGISTGVLSGIGVACGQVPLLGALFIAAMSALLVATSLRGVHLALAMAPISVCFVMVSPPALQSSAAGAGPADISLSYCLALGAVIAFGGLWTGLLLFAATRALGLNFPAGPPLTKLGAWSYGAVLISTTAIAGYCILEFLPGSTGAWVLLTLYIVVRPAAESSLLRAGHRILGTVLGVVLAAVASLLVTGAQAQFWTGLAFMIAALAIYLKAPYWAYVALLTPAVILFGSNGSDVLSRDLDRLKFTVAGIALLVVAALISRGAGRMFVPRLQAEEDARRHEQAAS